jgi:hypothetical protein
MACRGELCSPAHLSGATRRKNFCLLSPDICFLLHARRSEEKAAIEENPRHSGLDPESRIVFSGAMRRKIMTNKLDSGSSPE